jgi:hypothetical protein
VRAFPCLSPGNSLPSAGINRIRFDGSRPIAASQPRVRSPGDVPILGVSERRGKQVERSFADLRLPDVRGQEPGVRQTA